MPTAPRRDEQAWALYAEEVGLRLARARQTLGLSQERVAHRAGLTGHTLQKLEKGETRPGVPLNPKLRTLIALAQVLQVELSDLLPPTPPDLTARSG